MNWNLDRQTGHWHTELEGHKLRLQKSTWGNSPQLAWEIYIDGIPHGKELNLACAKAEAKRELIIKLERAAF